MMEGLLVSAIDVRQLLLRVIAALLAKHSLMAAFGRDQLYTTLKFAVVQRLLTGPHRSLNFYHHV